VQSRCCGSLLRKKSNKENTEMNLAAEKKELQSKIDALLSKPHLTASERKTVDGYLSRVADIRGREERQARLASALEETRRDVEEDQPEYRAAKQFDRWFGVRDTRLRA